MYRPFNRRSGGNNRFFHSNGRGFRGGGRPIRSFNPTALINTPIQKQTVETPKIMHQFADFNLLPILVRNIANRGYVTPTPIQDVAIEPIMKGRDLIGIANTGTGKTAAFLIPLINKVLKDPYQKVLIVAPTRELAVQIRDEFMAFARGLRLYAATCIGGANMHRQISDIRRNPHFIIGTPGRLKDLIRSRILDLSRVDSVVLDEADHMVDIGFIDDVKFIISYLPKVRQSLFFSATIDGKVQEVIRSFVLNPVTVSVKTKDTLDNIEQNAIRVIDRSRKIEQLHDLLIKKECEKVLVFGRTKHGVQKLSDELVKRGFRADAIHGNKSQNYRLRTLDRFKRSEIQILLATDVASRGLDIPNVSHVVNYDLPESYEAYIHRIGRTGRAEKKGVALTFVE